MKQSVSENNFRDKDADFANFISAMQNQKAAVNDDMDTEEDDCSQKQ